MEIDSSLCGKSTPLEVDVHLHFSSGDRKKLIVSKRAKSLIKNVAQQNWKAAVNIAFKHPACQDHIKEAIRYIHTYILYWLVPTGLFRINFTLQNYKPST